MAPLPYALLMAVRLALDLLVVVAILASQDRRITDFPIVGPAIARMTLMGLVVMVIAILASGVLFMGIHISKTGTNWFWLFRLFVKGTLLAYAVYRTGSFWWSTRYHAGWN